MNQNFAPLSEDKKEAFDAAKQAATSPVTCTVLEHMFVVRFQTLFIYLVTKTHTNYIVFLCNLLGNIRNISH